VNAGTLYALGAGVALGAYFVMTRAMAGVANAMVLTFQTSAIGAALMTLALPLLWVPPSPEQWAMLAALGVIATLGHVLITKAYEHAEASLLAPLASTEIVMATVLGYAFFADLPDRWTVLGVTILIASAVYISVRERRAKA
jgi:drug/metabolite transporter (DMT)-like permease